MEKFCFFIQNKLIIAIKSDNISKDYYRRYIMHIDSDMDRHLEELDKLENKNAILDGKESIEGEFLTSKQIGNRLEMYNFQKYREFLLISLYYSKNIERNLANQSDAAEYIFNSIDYCNSTVFYSLVKHNFLIYRVIYILKSIRKKIVETVSDGDDSYLEKRHCLNYKNKYNVLEKKINELLNMINTIKNKKVYFIHLYLFKKKLNNDLSEILSKNKHDKELSKFQVSMATKIKSFIR